MSHVSADERGLQVVTKRPAVAVAFVGEADPRLVTDFLRTWIKEALERQARRESGVKSAA